MALFHCVVRLGSVRFAFPLQFSTVLEWAGLYVVLVAPPQDVVQTKHDKQTHNKNFFILHCPIKLSLDPLLGYQQEERLYFLQTWFGCLKKGAFVQTKVAFDLSLAVLI